MIAPQCYLTSTAGIEPSNKKGKSRWQYDYLLNTYTLGIKDLGDFKY